MISYLFNNVFTKNIELQIDTISIPKFFQIGMLPGVGDDRHGETSRLFSGHCQADSVDGNATPADNVLIVLFRIFNVNKDRKSTRLNSSHVATSYAVFCLKTTKRG